MSTYTEQRINEHGDEDIYRGDPPSHIDIAAGPAPSILSLSSSSTDSSSSSSSFMGGGRLGAIAAKLEVAISRWSRNVRGNSSVTSGASSSSSSSSSSSCSSIVTLTKSQIARRRRKNTRAMSSVLSERNITARINRMKALEKSREIPREFALYLPPSITPTPLVAGAADPIVKSDRRITWTTSLPLVLHQLELATRRPGRNHRGRARVKHAQSSRTPDSERYFERQAVSGETLDDAHLAASARRGKKGKQRAVVRVNPTTILEELQVKPEAWFLDVANPTWADLRAIGKVLHIHPLTLEDILQQDPREKLEIFSKLGYYFISFRTIESQATREKIRREVGLKDIYDENYIGEANVYLTVFKGGICCFHFTDVSEHTDRVRNRMVLLEQVVNMSSDWIAHDILDSIVDSFFPVLNEIEKEVTAIDYMVYNIGDLDAANSIMPAKSENTSISQQPFVDQRTSSMEKDLDVSYTPAEKLRETYRPRFVSPRLSLPLLARRVRRQISFVWNALWVKAESPPSGRQETLRRMARTRKQVTVLGRLLATKADVVTQIRKRLAKAGANTQGNDELEVYMGDVEDHILTLQHALAHYDRLLSQSHPTYLSQMRSESDRGKGSMDMNILYLSTVSIGALTVGPLVGVCSMNVHILTNLPSSKLNGFAIVISLSITIIILFLLLVRHWWRQAKKKVTRY